MSNKQKNPLFLSTVENMLRKWKSVKFTVEYTISFAELLFVHHITAYLAIWFRFVAMLCLLKYSTKVVWRFIKYWKICIHNLFIHLLFVFLSILYIYYLACIHDCIWKYICILWCAHEKKGICLPLSIPPLQQMKTSTRKHTQKYPDTT